MSCPGDEDRVVDALLVERLLGETKSTGMTLLDPIERDIVEGLTARPSWTWCRYQLLMLECLHAKAHGRPWTQLAGRG